jgi:uncharacterized membrane protein
MDRVLYCGDTSIDGAAAYLAGLMTSWGWEFNYVASDQSTQNVIEQAHQLYVFSDYPASMLTDEQQRIVLENVSSGAGLLMIGGWESFHGLGGDWDQSRLAIALPVEISDVDDRVNSDSPVMVQIHDEAHAIVDSLPWYDRPPLIGGYNRFTARPTSRVVLQALRFRAHLKEGLFRFQSTTLDPLLVTGEHGSGRTAALATDVAPHWVGPLVDWGDQRVSAQAEGSWEIEVGNLYAQFFQQLLSWTGKF